MYQIKWEIGEIREYLNRLDAIVDTMETTEFGVVKETEGILTTMESIDESMKEIRYYREKLSSISWKSLNPTR